MSEPSSSVTSAASSATSKIRELLESYRLPGLDLDAFIASRQADIDAISKATAVAFAGAETITETQISLLKAALGELNEALSSCSAATGGTTGAEEVAKKQGDLVQHTLSRTLDYMKQMAEAAQQAQMKIFDIALERARGSAQELRALFITQKK